MTAASILPFITALVFLVLGVVVFVKRSRTPTNIGFMMFAAATIWWQGSWAILFNTTNIEWAGILVRVGYSGIIFLPVAYYHFTVEYVQPGVHRRSIRWNYGIGLFFLLSLWATPFFIRGYYTYTWGFYPKAGYLHLVFLAYLSVLALIGLYLPFKQLQISSTPSLRKTQLRWVLIANFIYCGGAVDFLVNYGVSFYPFGFFFVLLSSLTYAVVRYVVLDLNLAFRQAFILAFSAALLSLPFIGLIWATESKGIVYLVVFGLFLIAPKLTQGVSGFLTGAIDQLPPFRGRYGEFKRLSLYFHQIGLTETVPDWANTVVSVVGKLFRPRSVLFLLRDEPSQDLIVHASHGLDPAFAVFTCLPVSGALATHLAKTRMAFIGEVHLHDLSKETREKIEGEMEFLKGTVYAPIFLKEVLYGILVLGPKGEGRVYNSLDLASLEALARAAEHTLHVILRGVSHEQMTAVWAHDLMKPFSQKGSFSVLEKMLEGTFGTLTDAMRRGIEPMLGDVAFVRKHLNRLLYPGEVEKFEIKPGALTPVFERLKGKFERIASAQGLIWRVTVPPPQVRVFWDKDMVEHRVLENLIENAFRHTGRNGTVELGHRIEGRRCIVFVKDSGEGIRKEDMDKLFQARSQVEDGHGGIAGLGLFSARTVVEAQKGKIWVESVFGKGATFYFDLPLESLRDNSSNRDPNGLMA